MKILNGKNEDVPQFTNKVMGALNYQQINWEQIRKWMLFKRF